MKRKALAAVGMALLLTLSAAAAFAAPMDDAGGKKKIQFSSYSGVIEEISTRPGTDLKIAVVDAGQDQIAHFVISPDTFVSADLKTGDQVTGYFDGSAPMIMIYPPQYAMEAVTVDDGKGFIHVARFGSDLVSDDNYLKLNLDKATPIVTQEGSPYTGSLTDRDLAVFYQTATRSIPAQTTPLKVVVLYSRTQAPFSNMTGPEIEAAAGPVGTAPVVVEGRRIETAKPYVTEDGALMVPVRAIAEGLGQTVGWDQATHSVTVGSHIRFAIGDTTYRNTQTATLWQASPAVLKSGTTYVPLPFFKALGLANNAYFFEGQFDIDTQEPMN